MAKIVWGNLLADRIKQEIASSVNNYVQKGKRLPTLAVCLVGNNPASESYVKGKDKACKEVGFGSLMIHLDENITMSELLEVINSLNNDNSVDGILVQLPLPKHLNEIEVINAIRPDKDVDGLNPINVGKLYLNQDGFVPCTPLGVIEILKEMNVEFQGANAVVIGRSKLVGNPVAKLLQDLNCTVTITHSKTKDIQKICKNADILVCAIGKPKLINHNWVKENSYVVDVGINRVDGKLYGDVDFDDVKDHVEAITPVPKGVGPMTICMLLKNTLKAYEIHEEK